MAARSSGPRLVRWLALAGAGALFVLAAASGAAPPPAPAWIDAPGLHADAHFYFATTAPEWTGARERLSVCNGDLRDERVDGACPEGVWAARTPKSSQRVQFTRRVYLPGKPARLTVSLYSVSQRLSGRCPRDPVRMIELRINNGLLLRTRRAARKTAVVPGAFAFGWNTLKVVAEKAATKRECDAAVVAELRGEYEADMTATEQVGLSGCSAADRLCLLTYPVTLKNLGPSTVLGYTRGSSSYSEYGGHFEWRISTGNYYRDNPRKFSFEASDPGGFYECSANHPVLLCKLVKPLQAGQSVELTIRFPWGPTPPPGPGGVVTLADAFTTSWSIYGWGDRNPANSQGTAPHGICAPAPCTPPRP